MITEKPRETVWTMRRNWLPQMEENPDRYWKLETWMGEHPSLQGITVWYRGYLPTLAGLLEMAYGDTFRAILREEIKNPKRSWWGT